MKDQFQNKIQEALRESGVDGLTGIAKEFATEQLGEQIFQRVVIQMTQDLKEEQLAAFLEFLDNDTSSESIEVFLSAVYPNFEEVISQKTLEVLEEYKQALLN